MTKTHKQTASTEVSEEPTNESMATCKKSNNTKTMAIKCSLWNKSFSSRQRLTLHIRGTHKYLDSDDDVEHQQDVEVDPDTDEEARSEHKQLSRFPCSFCNKVFGTTRSLKLHFVPQHIIILTENC